MTAAKIKRYRKKAHAAFGFERNPPRCISCEHYKPPVHGVPGRSQHVPPRCGLGNFPVEAHSICDRWIGADGSTVE